MPALFADENFPQQVIEALRGLGHDVLTAHEAGYSNRAVTDEEILSVAASLGRTLLTLNRRDFIRLHLKASSRHGGIIVCTQDADTDGQSKRIHEAIAAAGALAGSLIRVNRP